jgi:hypothetical protein
VRESCGSWLRSPVRLTDIPGRPPKRIERTLTTESAAGARPAYGKEPLNCGENSAFFETNHFSFAGPVRFALSLVKTAGGPTKRTTPTLRPNVSAPTALRIKRIHHTPRKQTLPIKRIIYCHYVMNDLAIRCWYNCPRILPVALQVRIPCEGNYYGWLLVPISLSFPTSLWPRLEAGA